MLTAKKTAVVATPVEKRPVVARATAAATTALAITVAAISVVEGLKRRIMPSGVSKYKKRIQQKNYFRK